MQLRDYESVKFQLAECLRAISALGAAPKDQFDEPIRELFARLAEDRFNLVVVGRFNRGKTSLMNAILGMERLPTGILPLTSVITRVSYGSHEKVQIEFVRGGLPADIPLERLHEYVTQQGNPGNRMGIREAIVTLPTEILRRGFHFIDTPGLGSAISENTRTTEHFLPEADAILLVSGCDSPLTDDELQLIRRIASDRRKLFLVINKKDMVSAQGGFEVLQFMREQLTATLSGVADLPLFLVSARDGLLGKLREDATLLESSGLPVLERALIEFLTQDKRVAFLLGLCARLRALLVAMGSNPTVDSNALQSVANRLAAFEQEFALASDAAANTYLLAASSKASSPITRVADCSVCSRIIGEWFEFLRRYQGELAVSGEERGRFAQRGGFCERHMRLYASLASERDLCLALTPLLERAAADLNTLSASEPYERKDPEANWLGRSACALCEIEEATEVAAFGELGEAHKRHLSDMNLALPSACLPHLRLMAKREFEAPQADTFATVRALMRQQAAAADRLAEDTQRYVLKRDALRHGLASEEEGEAARMAVSFLVGHPKVMPRSSRF